MLNTLEFLLLSLSVIVITLVSGGGIQKKT